MEGLIEPYQHVFMQNAFGAATLVGLTAAVLGVRVIQRRMAFISDALAHLTLPGLVVAYLSGWSLSRGGMIAALLAAFAIGWLSRQRQLREDTAIGVIFTGMLALGVLLMSRTKSFRDLSHMLFGNVLGVVSHVLVLIAGLTGLVLLVVLLLQNELELAAFDVVHAEVIGIRTDFLRLILLVLLALIVVTGIQTVGVVLTSALLITPAATAALITERFPRRIALAAIFAVCAAIVGLLASYFLHASSGASIVLACAAIFGLVVISRFAWQCRWFIQMGGV